MKINSIKNDFTLKPGIQEAYRNSQHDMKAKGAGLCEKNNRGYNVAFNGSLPGELSGAAVNVSKSFGMKSLDWLLEFVKDHNVSGSALMALFLAGALRPATIMALPGKDDKDDKIYASGHSMASGVIGFLASVIATTPWDNGVNKIKDNYRNHYNTVLDNLKNGTTNEPEPIKFKFNLFEKKYEKLVELQKKAIKDPALKRECKNYINALEIEMKNLSDWAIAIPRSMLTIALIPPILKYVFGLEKKKAGDKKETTPAQTQQLQADNTKQKVETAISKLPNAFSDFKGGKQ